MTTKDDIKKKRKDDSNEIPINEKDPTIRQEFPGAETNKKKIEAGIRNIKDKTPSPPSNQPVPPTPDEPVEEKSDEVKPDH